MPGDVWALRRGPRATQQLRRVPMALHGQSLGRRPGRTISVSNRNIERTGRPCDRCGALRGSRMRRGRRGRGRGCRGRGTGGMDSFSTRRSCLSARYYRRLWPLGAWRHQPLLWQPARPRRLNDGNGRLVLSAARFCRSDLVSHVPTMVRGASAVSPGTRSRERPRRVACGRSGHPECFSRGFSSQTPFIWVGGGGCEARRRLLFLSTCGPAL